MRPSRVFMLRLGRPEVMREAQAAADTGEPVVVVSADGSYGLSARKEAIEENLQGIEFATAMDEAQQ